MNARPLETLPFDGLDCLSEAAEEVRIKLEPSTHLIPEANNPLSDSAGEDVSSQAEFDSANDNEEDNQTTAEDTTSSNSSSEEENMSESDHYDSEVFEHFLTLNLTETTTETNPLLLSQYDLIEESRLHELNAVEAEKDALQLANQHLMQENQRLLQRIEALEKNEKKLTQNLATIHGLASHQTKKQQGQADHITQSIKEISKTNGTKHPRAESSSSVAYARFNKFARTADSASLSPEPNPASLQHHRIPRFPSSS